MKTSQLLNTVGAHFSSMRWLTALSSRQTWAPWRSLHTLAFLHAEALPATSSATAATLRDGETTDMRDMLVKNTTRIDGAAKNWSNPTLVAMAADAGQPRLRATTAKEGPH